MRIGLAAQALGVNDKTLRNWLDNELLSPFFSDRARGVGGVQREVSDIDLVTLNTVRVERSKMPTKTTDWQAIADVLASGHRDRNLPPQAMAIDTGLSMIAQTERVAGIINERDTALRRVEELEADRHELRVQLIAAQNELAKDRERLLREMNEREARLKDAEGELKARLAEVELELKLWRSGRLRPE